MRSARLRLAWATLLLVASATACSGGGGAPAGVAPTASANPSVSEAPSLSAERPAGSGGHPALAESRADRAYLEVPQPVGMRIPRIAVSSEIIELGKAPDETVEVPKNPDQVGWYAGGPRPGAVGPAVLLGHVNSARGAAVFFRLGELRPGDEVLVDRDDGSHVRFEVTHTERWRKDGFPTADVYYPTLDAELRLVTCGGPIDPRTGRHRDNVIVHAVLVS